jgi:class 3 adenylate cyclase/tetratricopeptide (TPR) repeat protein
MTVVCPACAFENPEGARFCAGCGKPLAAPAPAREVRKTVTVVFCDVTGSTALGERLDPESLRHVLARYFEAMRTVIERHGGTVEKFIGDAVMAVFGVPIVHEDDALRAARAATEMREALASLNEALERDYGARLELRTGVNTGEVVTGTEERLATGDAVNVAARLEQAAAPGEVLLGPETMRLLRGAVTAEELAPLELKGKAEGVPAFRLVTVAAAELPRRLDAPMIGRQRELRLLADAWERAAPGRTCLLFTLLGAAGVGKSRLTREFLSGVDATVVRGRCLSYGEDITYWPVTEIVLRLAQLGHDVGTGPLAALLGEGTPTSPEEIALAFRRLLEQAASERPLLVVFDDLHWGEPGLLDLIEHVATMSRGAPILLLCLGRPELLDRRPAWGGGLLNATTVLLEPLSAAETEKLIQVLAGRLDAGLAARIRDAADGNPLFVEEMTAMVEEGGDGDVVVPPTVQALLAARLDQLDGDERSVLERGAVEGQVFHRGAVQALSAAEADLSPRLSALVRKELVRPETALFAGDDAYRFRHTLIRDAAYDALPKATRADLHERFADWLEDHAQDLLEGDEILGYHLEQAYRYRAELGPVDHAGRSLAARASERLAAGAAAARMRGDYWAAAGLLGRSAALLPATETQRLELELELVRTLFDTGEFDRASDLIDRVSQAAAELMDERLSALARLEELMLGTYIGGVDLSFDPDELERVAAVLERARDEVGLAHALSYVGRTRFYAGHCAAAEEAYDRATELARRHGLRREERDWHRWQAAAKRFGPTRAGEAIAFLEELIARAAREGMPIPDSNLLRAALIGMQGDIDAARALVRETAPVALELGVVASGIVGMEGGYVELLAGSPGEAVRLQRGAWERYAAIGETGFRSTIGTMLAEALAACGDDPGAEAVLAEVETFAAPGDFDAQVRLRWVRATILARRGEFDKAERLARDAVEIVDRTDYVDAAADAHSALGSVLDAAGRPKEAAAERRAALDLYRRKGNLVRAAQIRERLAA